MQLLYICNYIGHVKIYPDLPSVAAEKTRADFFFYPRITFSRYARENYVQTRNTVVGYNIFNAITLFINITIAKNCQGPSAISYTLSGRCQLAIPKLMSGLGTSVKKCPNYEMNQITKKGTSTNLKLVSIQSLKTFT